MLVTVALSCMFAPMILMRVARMLMQDHSYSSQIPMTKMA